MTNSSTRKWRKPKKLSSSFLPNPFKKLQRFYSTHTYLRCSFRYPSHFYLIKWLETTNPQNLQSLQLQNDNKLRYRLFLDLEELVSYWHLLLVHVCTCVLFFSNHESIFFPYAWLRIDGACSKIKLLSCWYAIPCSSDEK